MMKTDFVKKFPPCFRCNKNKCGCSNNILIKHQIGNWCSFINVMNDIIKNDYNDLIMICEDDVKFTNNGMDILNKMITKDNLEKYNISFEKPILIRAEQRGNFPHLNELKLTKKITMSNACFIINKFYAESFINNLKVIDRTSDMYLQYQILKFDKNIQHFTIEPSSAYQLSDNKNAIFKSEIHPKGIDNKDKIKAKNHFKRVDIYKIINERKKINKSILVKINSHPCAGKTTFINKVKNDKKYENIIMLDFDNFHGKNRTARLLSSQYNNNNNNKIIILFGSILEIRPNIGLVYSNDYEIENVISMSVFISEQDLIRNITHRKKKNPTSKWADKNKILDIIEKSYERIFLNNEIQPQFKNFNDAIEFIVNLYNKC